MTTEYPYVETPWRDLTITGRVRGQSVRGFAAEDRHGQPVRVAASELSKAHAALVDTARELSRFP